MSISPRRLCAALIPIVFLLTGVVCSTQAQTPPSQSPYPGTPQQRVDDQDDDARQQREAPAAEPNSADPRSDEAGSRIARSDKRNVAKSESSDKTQAAEDEDENPSDAASESESDAGTDTLGSPRKPED